MSLPQPLQSATRPVSPAVAAVLEGLQPGQRIRVTQHIRIGQKQWETSAEGVFRGVNYLTTGLSTQRLREDDIIVPTVHFTKDNGELSSIALDEHSRIEVLADNQG
jgi:hypothetical protein